MPAPLEIKVLNINAASWTPVVVPFECSSIAVKNPDENNPVRMRTAAGDASTEDTLGPCREQSFAVPFHRYRFLAGSQPLWLQGAGSVVVKFLAALTLLVSSAWGQLGQTGGPVVPPPLVCESTQSLSMTNQGTAQVVAGEPGRSIHVCGFVLNSAGNTTVKFVQGSGSACTTGQTGLTPPFKLTNGTNVTFGGPSGPVIKLGTGRTLCVTTTSNPDVAVFVSYTKR